MLTGVWLADSSQRVCQYSYSFTGGIPVFLYWDFCLCFWARCSGYDTWYHCFWVLFLGCGDMPRNQCLVSYDLQSFVSDPKILLDLFNRCWWPQADTEGCNRAEIARLGNQLDYVGIVALITGSFIPSVYYGFHCEPLLRKIYWFMVLWSSSIFDHLLNWIQISSIGLVCTIISIRPKFRSSEWREFRATMFILMGLSAVFPVIHGTYLYGVRSMNERIGLSWVVLQGFLYILGASLYAVRDLWLPVNVDGK